jgi:hypothetical protein
LFLLLYAKGFVEVEDCPFMKKALGAQDTNSSGRKIGRFCSWLCGFNPKSFHAPEMPISRGLPRGITIQEATAEQLGEALKSAINTSGYESEAIVKFVFSQLDSSEVERAEVVIRAVLPVIPADAVIGFVQTAAKARPSLALTVAKVAAAMVPEQSTRIATALDSVVAGAALNLLTEPIGSGP